MKFLFILTGFIFCSCFNTKYELPKTWDKNFSIVLYQGGGMNYESTNILFSYDSCKYVEMNEGVHKITRFKLSDKSRNAILKKLTGFNVESMETQKTAELINDKETTSICFQNASKKDHCISTGATTQIERKYVVDFYKAYQYLLALAKEKGN